MFTPIQGAVEYRRAGLLLQAILSSSIMAMHASQYRLGPTAHAPVLIGLDYERLDEVINLAYRHILYVGDVESQLVKKVLQSKPKFKMQYRQVLSEIPKNFLRPSVLAEQFNIPYWRVEMWSVDSRWPGYFLIRVSPSGFWGLESLHLFKAVY